MHIKLLIKLASFLYPIRIKSTGASDKKVSLYYYRDRWQLATDDAIYSDGSRYRPLVIAFQHIAKQLHTVTAVLVLGAGLGSAKDVLEKMSFKPSITFVDKNVETLQWAKDLHDPLNQTTDIYYCDDASNFIQSNTARFGLIVVDVFEGRIVPDFALQETFLRHCKATLSSQGILVMNYIQHQTEQWDSFYKVFASIFPKNEILPLGVNKILVAYSFAD